MAGELPISKIYIDTRYKTRDSVSSSHFKYELAQSVALPDNCVCFIDDIIIPNSWYTIGERNYKLYTRVITDVPASNNDVIIELSINNYTAQTLRNELSTKLNDAYGNIFTITYNADLLTYTIDVNSVGKSFKIFTDDELKNTNNWSGDAYNTDNLLSANEIITNTVPYQGTVVRTGLIDLRRYHNIYITSPNLASFSTLGPRGEGNIIKKVPVVSDYGSIIYNNIVAQHEYFSVSKLLLKTLEFKLVDVHGNVIDLRGAPISFSLVFMIADN